MTLALATARASLKILVQFCEISIKSSGALRNGSLKYSGAVRALRLRATAAPPWARAGKLSAQSTGALAQLQRQIARHRVRLTFTLPVRPPQ